MSTMRKRLPSGSKKEVTALPADHLLKKNSLKQMIALNSKEPAGRKEILREKMKLQALDRQI